MIEQTYWFMFPISILVATIAMTAGIGGAVLFSPLFFLFLNLKPDVAIGTGIFIEIFGFSSGFVGYARKKLIDYKLGKKILILAVPSAIIGVLLGKVIEPSILQLIFGIAIIILGISFIHKERQILVKDKRFHELHLKFGKLDRCYRIEHGKESIYLLSALGGLFIGLLSAGLGEINEYNFIKRIKLKGAVAAGTSVFIVIITALIASLSHFIYMYTHFSTSLLLEVLSIILFAAPGVIIGAQLGVQIAQRITTDTTKRFLFVLFTIIGILSIAKLVI